MIDKVFFRRAGEGLGLNVYRRFDGEWIGYVGNDDCVELRDLLLREFPLEDPVDRVVERLLPDAAIKERRERIATAALAGIVSRHACSPGDVELAINMADQLIAALDKEQP